MCQMEIQHDKEGYAKLGERPPHMVSNQLCNIPIVTVDYKIHVPG